ncbi:hypothetical protein [Sulfitobacter sp. MF3-043]|uniref:hypothetical protein n=1 Tax=Sulfitobacter sediminivivens TaxID=3252902 RepID=UPI0036D9AB8A
MHNLFEFVRSIGWPSPGAIAAATGEIIKGANHDWLPQALAEGGVFYPCLHRVEIGTMGAVFRDVPFTCPRIALAKAQKIAVNIGVT